MKSHWIIKFGVVCIVIVGVIAGLSNPVGAYSSNFDNYAPGTDASALNIAGMTLSGHWSVAEQPWFKHLDGHTLTGCFGPDVTPAPLTINFVSPQNFIGFNYATMGLQTVTVEAYAEGVLVASGSFTGQDDLPDYPFPEGYASLNADEGFDTVIVHIDWCTAIDHLETANSTTVAYSKIGQIRVTAPGVALYESAGGGVVRDSNSSEIWVPNPNANNPHEDTYDVISQVEIGKKTWVQIFVGGTDYVWVPVGGSVTVVTWE